MRRNKTTLLLLTLLAAGAVLTSCTGRRADTMVPLGETVEVVIPEGDLVRDSAIAAGDVAGDTVVAAVAE
ncbi:hypothetical protein HDR69_05100 [bacterium]|nr:hypothetical protein [bacterium]